MHSLLTFLALVTSTIAAPAAEQSIICKSQSQPNPIAKDYPKDVTGTINGTHAIIPIPISVAKSWLPPQYSILIGAWNSLLPNFPDGMFPALMAAVQDHDVQMNGLGIPDFTRMAIRLPFIDRLNDGYSCFAYTPPQLISLNLVAYLGSTFYGETVLGTNDPYCDGYASSGKDTTYLNGYIAPGSKLFGSKPNFATSFTTMSGNPWNIDAFQNMTNQPSFGSNVPLCDNYIVLFNSSVTQGRYAPQSVKGTVKVTKPFYPTDTTFNDVWGYRMDNSFIERNNVPCESLKGYSGSGPGD